MKIYKGDENEKFLEKFTNKFHDVLLMSNLIDQQKKY